MIIVPVIIIATMVVVQFTLIWHGRHVAQAAAQTAARAAATYRGSAAAGQADGDGYLGGGRTEPASRADVQVTRDASTVTAAVHSGVLTVIPFGSFTVDERATAPVETVSVFPVLADDRAPLPLDPGRATPSEPTAPGGDADRGSSTVELVVVTPIVIALLLLVVAFGRYAHGRQLVEQAAAAAARAASLSPTAVLAGDRARRAAAASLSDAGVSCASMDAAVDAADFRAGGTVTVTVTCRADLSGWRWPASPGRPC